LDETKYSTTEGNYVQLKETMYSWKKTRYSWRKPGTSGGNHYIWRKPSTAAVGS